MQEYPHTSMKFIRYTYEGVEAIERPLKCGEAELYKDVGNEDDDIQSQPPHVHHKVLKKELCFFPMNYA